jgi:transposase
MLPPRKHTGRVSADDRSTLNGILWVLGTGARWADLPRRYGVASTCRVRFREWQKQGVWERICQVLRETRADDSR